MSRVHRDPPCAASGISRLNLHCQQVASERGRFSSCVLRTCGCECNAYAEGRGRRFECFRLNLIALFKWEGMEVARGGAVYCLSLNDFVRKWVSVGNDF